MLTPGVVDAAAYADPPATAVAGYGSTSARETVHMTLLTKQFPPV